MKKLLIAIPFLVLGAAIAHHKRSKKDRKDIEYKEYYT